MIAAQYIARLDQNTQQTLQLIKSIEPKLLLLKKENEWNVLEVLEHIYLTDRTVYRVLSRSSNKTAEKAERFGDEKLNRLIAVSTKKMEAPDYIKPKGLFHTIGAFEEAFLRMRNTLKTDLTTGTLRIDNRVYQHPVLGEMTVSDWLLFLLYHTNRHLAQIRKVSS